MNQIELQGPLGQKIMVEFTDYPHSLALMREWGARGFTSGTVPHGGYQLPYCMADSFDWALIGARKWTNPEGEEVILHQGKAYKRRELGANEKKNMPAVIKYSRGAKNSDPEHLKEGEDGGFQYVTLAVFRGNGKTIPDYEAPRQGQQQRPPQQQQATEAEQTAPRNWAQEWKEVAGGTHYNTKEGRDEVGSAVARDLNIEGAKNFTDLWHLQRDDVYERLIFTAKAWIAEDQQQQAS